MSFLPDGRLLYLAERPSAQSCVTEACSDSFAAHVVSPDTGESSLVLERIGGLAYTETGDGQSVLLFLRGNELWAQPVDTRSLRLSGNPVRQTTGVMAVSSSTNGVVVTRSGRPSGTWTAADRRVTAMAATPLPENCT